MKKLILLAIALAAGLVSLHGCYWVEPWHGGHERGHYYHHHEGRENR